ncbi:hypothetical protein CCHR01_00620 [Colletotrichum chrysophilum]|uniref:Cytochrome P450 n=1 Tax=Colletotrichum chrysophilum TaxID=1836956 RepID=A0AAD9EPU7_9PEZI|nr:hypothetical protein CCHR01_00620 [Colletotrichum chrysophilum]
MSVFDNPIAHVILLSSALLLGFAFALPSLFETFSSLRRLPGPFPARISRLWYLKQVSTGNFHQVNIDLHRTYVRIAPNQYSIDDPAVIKTIYGIGKGFPKAAWYEASSAPNPPWCDLFTDRNSARHAANRRIVANLYSVTTLKDMEPEVEDCIRQFVSRLTHLSKSGGILDLQFWMQCYAFDVISQITLGKRFGFLDSGKDNLGMFKSLHAYLKYCALVGIEHELHRPLWWLITKLPAAGLMHVANFTTRELENGRQVYDSERLDKSAVRKDFMSKLFRLQDENPDKFPSSAIFATCMTNIGAGSDTTSISLCAILYDLITNPNVLDKLRQEIDATFAELGDPEFIPFKAAQALCYLQACVKESLRLHPATGLPLARVVPTGGSTLAGTHFPEGSVVGVNTWVLHRNSSIFGLDADRYRPERWLDDDKDKLSLMEANWIPFGTGSRTCIGKNVSLLEINKLIPVLVKRFNFSCVNSQTARHENYWLVKQVGIHCKVSSRAAEDA